jgi:hypothetical protein
MKKRAFWVEKLISNWLEKFSIFHIKMWRNIKKKYSWSGFDILEFLFDRGIWFLIGVWPLFRSKCIPITYQIFISNTYQTVCLVGRVFQNECLDLNMNHQIHRLTNLANQSTWKLKLILINICNNFCYQFGYYISLQKLRSASYFIHTALSSQQLSKNAKKNRQIKNEHFGL